MIFADLLLEKEFWLTEETFCQGEKSVSVVVFVTRVFARLDVTVFIQVQG